MDYKPLMDVGDGTPVILLHGLFGSLSNWHHTVNEFSKTHRVLIPRLPFYTQPISKQRLDDLVDYIERFADAHDLHDIIVMGNSLGGHVALLYAYKRPDKVKKLVLAGSSGLYENSFSGTFPRVKDYEYIRKKVAQTFYESDVATKELVDEVYETVQSRVRTLSIIGLARAAQRHNVSDVLGSVYTPTLLIWGLQDTITPPEVAKEFHKALSLSQLVLLERCGHVPMMEQPKLFNDHVREFLAE